MGMERHKVILDVDTGTGLPVCDIDDGIAIALALASPEIELLGCTTCGGNVRTHESTINTLRILEMAGRGDIPVAEGRANPFRQDVSASFAWLEQRSAGGRDFWYKDMPPLLEPTLSPSPLKAHEFIIEMVKKHPGEVTIVKEGSLTNLALAVLVEPEIAPLVKEVVHMGGHVGNRDWERVGPAALPPVLWRDILRMNTEFDPEATAIVIESGIPFTFVTGISGQAYLRMEHLERIKAGGTPYHEFLAYTSRPWIEWHSMERMGRPGACLWDPFTLAVVIDPTFCYFVTLRFDAERFLSGEDPCLYVSPDSPQVRVSVDPVQASRFETFLVDRLASPLP